MTTESKGKIHISVTTTKKVADAVAVISIPCDADWLMYKHITSTNSVPISFVQPNEHQIVSTVLAWTVSQHCETVLNGTPLAVLKSRVSRVASNVQNGCLNICFNTQNNLTFMRKCLTFVMKCLNTNTYSLFDKNVKALHLKVSKDEYNLVVTEFEKAVASKIQIAIVGRLNMARTIDGEAIPPSTTLKELREKLESLLPKSSGSPKPTKTIPPIEGSKYVKASGVSAFVLESYVKTVGGIPAELINHNLYITNANWDTIRVKLAEKSRIASYVKKKYGHGSLKDHLREILAYQIACSGNSDAEIVNATASKSVSVSAIEKAILTSLSK